MYDFFRGKIISIDVSGHLVLEVNDIGYRFRISEQTRQNIPLDESIVTIYAHLNVKEDDLSLFGFSDHAERVAFNLLTSVQGVGPSVAMAILSVLPIDELRNALINKEIAAFKQVKGVGPKSAERITLELHDKVDRIPGESIIPADPDKAPSLNAASDDARRALIALGFSAKQSEDAVAHIVKGDDSLSAEHIIRQALAVLR
ncbi:MAG: Holliday junction branch migration protein RuvA [Planctomycetes bacterium]|nr:Holliday junction branch migration protein RuvA [Planctomycetota bacterium]